MPSRRICSAISATASSKRSRRKSGAAFAAPKVARGAAYADINNDGALDILITTNGGAPHLYRNEGGTNQSLRVKLVGTKSNRDGIGAVVRVTAGGEKQWQTVALRLQLFVVERTGPDFRPGIKDERLTLSKSNGRAGRWTSSTTYAAGQTITVQEGKGIVNSVPYSRK